MSENDNLRHWPSDQRGVYEVWYVTWNHPGTDQGFWLRYTLEHDVDGMPRAELWFARFDPRRPDRTFGIHKRFPIDQLTEERGRFELAIAGSRLGHDHAIGQLAGNGHDIQWDLRWEPARDSLFPLPRVMYTGGGRGETTFVIPNPRVPLSGTLVVDGERLVFDRAAAGQSHVWGKKHAYSWVWGRCAEFAGAPDALLEILGARLQRRGITTPPLVVVSLDLDGERHRLNQFRHVVRNRGTWQGTQVSFSASSAFVRIEGELTCQPDQMIATPYIDPDGTEVFCMNTEIGDARITVLRRSGLSWREYRTLVARNRAHFELGSRMRDPAVVREHVLV